jgi:hypothetical protein
LQGTDGEASPVQSGFYECRVAGRVPPSSRWGEDTLLPLVNESMTETLCACILIVDGNQNIVFAGLTDLAPLDNDTVNLCALVNNLPAAGVVEVVTSLEAGGAPACADFATAAHQGGAYGWIKNVTYRGRKRVFVDPFSANVLAVAKTELRITPRGVVNPGQVRSSCLAMGANLLPATVYVDGTFE